MATLEEEYKRHRKFTVRTFPHKSMQLVHAETVKQTSQMMACWEKSMKDGSLVVER